MLLKIKYKRSKLIIDLVLGILWTFLGVLKLVSSEELRIPDFIFLFIGILYLGSFLFNLKYGYAQIKNDSIKTSALWGKEIKWIDLESFEQVHGDYTFRSKNKAIKINSSAIDEKSLQALTKFTNELKLKD